MSDINPGDVVRVSTSPGFTTTAGVLTDPTTVTLLWRRAGDATTTWTWTAAVPGTNIVRDSVGVFRADITVVKPGLHYYRWAGTGAIAASEESTFTAVSNFVSGAP